MTTRYCPKCGHEVKVGARFCPSCGQALTERAPASRKAGALGLRRVSPTLLILVLAGIILIAAGLLLDGSRPEGSVAQAPTGTPVEDIPFPNVRRVALAEAKEEFDGGDAFFVDVREPADYEASHIPGALSIPLGDERMDGAYRQLPEHVQIITYCT